MTDDCCVFRFLRRQEWVKENIWCVFRVKPPKTDFQSSFEGLLVLMILKAPTEGTHIIRYPDKWWQYQSGIIYVFFSLIPLRYKVSVIAFHKNVDSAIQFWGKRDKVETKALFGRTFEQPLKQVKRCNNISLSIDFYFFVTSYDFLRQRERCESRRAGAAAN